MNYAPAVQDQGANIIMQGLQLGAQSRDQAFRLWQYLNERQDRKDAAIGALDTMGAGDTGQAPAAGGFNPSSGGGDPAGEDSSAMDAAEANGKKADAIRNVLTAYDPHPQSKTALKAMSLGQLEGMLKGYAIKSAMQEHEARMQDYQAQATLRKQQAADDVSTGTFMKAYGQAPDVKVPVDAADAAGEGPMTTRSASPMERFNYAMGVSPVSGRVLPRLIDSLSKYGELNSGDPTVLKDSPYPGVAIVKDARGGVHVVQNPGGPNGQDAQGSFDEDQLTGQRFYRHGNVVLPSGVNPAKGMPNLIPQHDEDGNLVGWSHTDAKGRATFIQNKSGWTLRQVEDEEGNPIDGYYADQQGRIHDVRSAIEKSFGSRAKPGKAKPAAGSYKSADDVVTAFKAGKVSRADAAKILNQQFGVPLK